MNSRSSEAAEFDRLLAARLHRYLLREQTRGADDVREIWSQPLAVRIEEGDALAVDSILGWEDDAPRLRLNVSRNLSRFRRGDELHLGRGNDPGLGPTLVFVDHEAASGVLIVELPAFGGDRDAVQRVIAAGPPFVLDRTAIDTTALLLRALERTFGGADRRAEAVRALLAGRLPQRLDPERVNAAVLSVQRLAARDIRLNAAQQAAFVAGWASDPLHLIQGPPGTGKTWLLALLAAALTWRGERLLLTAFTHTAVDNAMLALARLSRTIGARLPLYRLKPRDEPALAEAGVTTLRHARQLPGHGAVICGATLLAAQALIDIGKFDRVVFDEAAQIPLPHALCALSAAPKWLLFGDDRQLGPVTVAEHEPGIVSTSLFSHLRDVCAPTVLDETWRLNDTLCRFPSTVFYGGRLQPTEQAAARRLASFDSESPFDAVLAPEPAAVWVRLDHVGCHAHAPAEVEAAADLAADLLLNRGLAADALAIVSPFRVQNREIARALATRLPDGAALPVIDTVERIQGQEREAVIVSLACSDPAVLRQDSGFFFSPQRLNVSLTRARRKLIVIASGALSGTLPRTQEGLEQVDLFLRLFEALPTVDWSDRYVSKELRWSLSVSNSQADGRR